MRSNASKKHRRGLSWVALALALCLSAHAALAQAPGRNGDRYYLRRDYALAQAAYAIELDQAPLEERETLQAKQALAAMQRTRYRDALVLLDQNDSFMHAYLRMFAGMRLGWLHQVHTERERITTIRGVGRVEQERVQLLESALLLEEDQFPAANAILSELATTAVDQEVRRRSTQALDAISSYEDRPHKSPWLAGAFSAVLPGAGYAYSDQWADGASAFLFTAATVGPALIMYDLERAADRPHIGSAVFGLLGLVFYVINIMGSSAAAVRYNNFQTRQFHERIRDNYFSVDYAAEASGVRFAVDFGN